MFSASSCVSMSTALKCHCKDKEFVHYARTERRPIWYPIIFDISLRLQIRRALQQRQKNCTSASLPSARRWHLWKRSNRRVCLNIENGTLLWLLPENFCMPLQPMFWTIMTVRRRPFFPKSKRQTTNWALDYLLRQAVSISLHSSTTFKSKILTFGSKLTMRLLVIFRIYYWMGRLILVL